MYTIIFSAVGIIFFYLLVILFFTLLTKFLRKKRDDEKKYMMISVRVSKENEAGPIVAEQIFATIHGIYEDLSVFERLLGKENEKISFEIANIDSTLRFYLRFPVILRNLIEGQIYAQYPDVEIEVVEDFSVFPQYQVAKKSSEKTLVLKGEENKEQTDSFKDIDFSLDACGATLGLFAPEILPIKRYSQFEDRLTRVAVDPLSGILATMAKLASEKDEVWVQLVLRPISDKWRTVFLRGLALTEKSYLCSTFDWFNDNFLYIFCTRKTFYRFLFFPFYFLLWIKSVRLKKFFSVAPPDRDDDDDEEVVTDYRHDRETCSSAARDKVTKLLFESKLRLVYISKNRDKEASIVKLKEIAGSFKQFLIPNINGLILDDIGCDPSFLEDYQKRSLEDSYVLNSEELATIFHLPNNTVQTPGIYWVRSRKLEPPHDLPTSDKVKDKTEFTSLGKTDYRGCHKEFGIKVLDRRRHMYIIGKTGMGKSTLLENMIFSDISAGRGVGIIDPHGDLAEKTLEFIPSSRTNDVIVFDPSDRDFPISFNMMENVDPSFNTIVASGLIGIFKKIYGDSWGPRLEHILRNTIISLLNYPDTTMLGITRILQDHIFRSRVVRKIEDPIVKAFWLHEFEPMQERQRIEAISPILNKVGQFLSSPIIRNIIGQVKSSINLRHAMDNKKIVIVNLSKGKIGEDNSSLLGALLITKFQLDAMTRANIPEKDRTDFYLYVDEFQNFATDSFATILSEARKYRLNLTMANQYIAQMPEEVRDAVFGNVGSIFSFQVGYDDAEYIMQQFAEEITTNDLVSLSKYTAYVRLLIDGMPSKTFSVNTLPPVETVDSALRKEKIMRTSRERYSKRREIVEDKIARWSVNTDSIKSLKDGKKEAPKSNFKKEKPLNK